MSLCCFLRAHRQRLTRYGRHSKARLTVDDEYNSSLDYILFTALIMEMKRKDHELVRDL